MATIDLATLLVKVKAETATYTRSMSGVKSELLSLTSLAKTAAAAIGGIWIGRKLINGIRNLTTSIIDQDMQLKKLDSVLKATGYITGYTSNQMNDLATNLQRTTTFTKEEILKAQTLAATFIEIRGLDFENTVQAILDLSVAMGTGLRQAALQVSKVLNNPIQLLGSLRRSGISFNEVNEKMIKGLWRMGEQVMAQNLILKIMREQGLDQNAPAMRDSWGGAIKGLINDLEQLGYAFAHAFENAIPLVGLLTKMSKKVHEFTDTIKNLTLTGWFDIFILEAKASFEKLGVIFSGMSKHLGKVLYQMIELSKWFWDHFKDSFSEGMDAIKSGDLLDLLAKQEADMNRFLEGEANKIVDIEKKRDDEMQKAFERRIKAAIQGNRALKESTRDAGVELKQLFKIGTAEDKLRMAQDALNSVIKGAGYNVRAAIETGKQGLAVDLGKQGVSQSNIEARVNAAAAYLRGGGKLGIGATPMQSDITSLFDKAIDHLSKIEKNTKVVAPVVQ